MLSGETATPVSGAGRTLAIIRDAETARGAPAASAAMDAVDAAHPQRDRFDAYRTMHGRAMCEAAVTLATSGQAEAIVAVTRYGRTAQLLSSLRPSASILAVTPSEVVARQLKLHWGVRPIVSELEDLRALEAPIRKAMDLSPRAVVVFINISPDLSRADANFLNVQRLAE
jgi:pyruvate kinase